jgi:hypothetical protein
VVTIVGEGLLEGDAGSHPQFPQGFYSWSPTGLAEVSLWLRSLHCINKPLRAACSPASLFGDQNEAYSGAASSIVDPVIVPGQ